MNELVPVLGGVVARQDDARREHLGQVDKLGDRGAGRVGVRWQGAHERCWENAADLTSGFKVNMMVMHVPVSSVHESFGIGVVRGYRTIAGHGQNLVEFPKRDHRVWLPWQRLTRIRGVKERIFTGRIDQGTNAELLRLRTLASAIELWNENTGSLATFDMDPLPHQIQLVHHILASGDYNWLIADDVGLGKTIEVGLLLSALRQRDEAARILLVTPAGITRQWKEEMHGRFGLSNFRIYGDDFSVDEPREWGMYQHVIASMDRLKMEGHLERVLQADPWDLVIFDEAHRLTRSDQGRWQEETDRYRMARMLRPRAESFVLLSATPHQGRQDRFAALLELLHPERREEFRMLDFRPEILSEMVFRNYKAEVTDMEGRPIFHGKQVHRIEVPSSLAARDFDRALRGYLRKGYDAERRSKGAAGRAIGFVMTVYRKLAASSVAAIHVALERRLARLRGQISKEFAEAALDDRFEGEMEEFQLEEAPRKAFFEHEEELLAELVAGSRNLMESDVKRDTFMNQLVEGVLQANPDEKILVFSEYRATQEWIVTALRDRFGADSAVCLHGSMAISERREAIDAFNELDGAQFMVSTEAGGEGINLQENCHVMVNYDLPWNPMRLVQRIGRLYRYGQKRKVVVFNTHQSDSADEQILETMYARLDQVATDMAGINEAEFNDALKDDILGELADLMDIEDVLLRADVGELTWSARRIDEALANAREAVSKQQDLFRHAAGFDPQELRGGIEIRAEHIQSFVEGMSRQLGIEILEKTNRGLVWNLRLPENYAAEMGFTRRVWKIAFDRLLAARRPELLHVDMNSWLLRSMVEKAQSPSFGGLVGNAGGLEMPGMFAAVVRWINTRGRRARSELILLAGDQSDMKTNPAWLGQWLVEPQTGFEAPRPDPAPAKRAFERAESEAEAFTVGRCSRNLLPDQSEWLSAAFKVLEV